MVLLVLTLVSGTAFLYYGYETLYGPRHRAEFERYGLSHLRVLVGSLQVLGALGALIGLVSRPIGAAATAGLALMMLVGVVVRYHVHDSAPTDGPGGVIGDPERDTSLPAPDRSFGLAVRAIFERRPHR